MPETKKEREERLKRPIGVADAAIAIEALKPQDTATQAAILKLLFSR